GPGGTRTAFAGEGDACPGTGRRGPATAPCGPSGEGELGQGGRRRKTKPAPSRGREPEAVAGVRPGPGPGPGPQGELGPGGLAGPAGRPTAFPLLADGPRGGGSGPGGGEAAVGPAELRLGGRGRAACPRPAPAAPIWEPLAEARKP